MKDLSIFAGITEFKAPNGALYRMTHSNRAILLLKDGSWHQVGVMPLRGGKSPKAVWRIVSTLNED